MNGKAENITRFRLDKNQLETLSDADSKRLDTMKDQEIDYSDIPELDDSFWENANIVSPSSTQQILLKLDAEVIAWFKSQGKGYQEKINSVLRTYVSAKKAG